MGPRCPTLASLHVDVRSPIFAYNVMMCGHIILCIITKYIAFYNFAELSAHASIVNTYVVLEDVSNVLSKTLKSQLCGSPLDFMLQLACKPFHMVTSRDVL